MATESMTVLFTDLVGSTELSSSLSVRAADELRRAHFTALRGAVEASAGTEVKNLGDGLMVGFESIGSSLSCAVAMQRAIDLHNRTSAVALAVRIGISTGDVTVEEGDYFGDPVVEAARLCAAAQGGQILVTDIIRHLAKRSGHAFATERELELKGLPDPVVAWELTWEPIEDQQESGFSLPARLPDVPATGLIGRAGPRDHLVSALKAVNAAEGARTVMVSGEAGVGKSTLTSSFARDAYAEGALVLYGRCDEELAVPYRPFVEAFDQYFAQVDGPTLSAMGPSLLEPLARLVPVLSGRLAEPPEPITGDPDTERWILFGAVVALIELASKSAPVILILDDVHWADSPSLQLLRHLTANLSGRALIVATHRDSGLSASHPLTELLAALSREQACTRLTLTGLDDGEVVSLVEAAAGHDLDEDGIGLAHALSRETDGNPFFVSEVLRHLVETRAVVQDGDGRWIITTELSDAGLPVSVLQVIGSRVARLGSEAERILAAAAVLGQEFEVDIVCSVTACSEDSVLDVLEAAASSALVDEVRTAPGRFRFAHALIQHTLYESLGATRRARLHRSAAEVMEARIGAAPGPRAGELARHWLSATGPSDVAKAVAFSRLAAEEALRALAPAEAVRWFGEALQLLAGAPDEGERSRCLAGLGEAQRQLGDPAFRGTLLEASRLAQSLGDVDTMVAAVLANNRGFQSSAGSVDDERVEMLGAAIEAVGHEDDRVRARLLALLALERTHDGDYPGRRALSDESVRLARRSGDPVVLLDVLMRRWLTVWIPETVEMLLDESIESVALAAEVGDAGARFRVADFRAAVAVQMGDPDEVERWHAEEARVAAEVGQPSLLWNAAFERSWSALLFGDVTGSEALAEEAFEIGRQTGQPDALPIYFGQVIALRMAQDRLGEIADMTAEIGAANPGLPGFRAVAALCLADVGRLEEARVMLEAETRLGFPGTADFLVANYFALWSRVAARFEDRVAAGAIYERLRGWPPHLVVFFGCSFDAAIAHFLGTLAVVLGRYDDACGHFQEALEVHERLRAPALVAETRLEMASALLARNGKGERAQAEQLLRTALDLAAEYGCTRVERLARARLDRLG